MKMENNISKKFSLESELSDWFKENYEQFGFLDIVEERVSSFPDFDVKIEEGTIGVELELKSSCFFEHGHNPKECDVVVCLVNDVDIQNVDIFEVRGIEYESDKSIKVEEKIWKSLYMIKVNEGYGSISKVIEALMDSEGFKSSKSLISKSLEAKKSEISKVMEIKERVIMVVNEKEARKEAYEIGKEKGKSERELCTYEEDFYPGGLLFKELAFRELNSYILTDEYNNFVSSRLRELAGYESFDTETIQVAPDNGACYLYGKLVKRFRNGFINGFTDICEEKLHDFKSYGGVNGYEESWRLCER